MHTHNTTTLLKTQKPHACAFSLELMLFFRGNKTSLLASLKKDEHLLQAKQVDVLKTQIKNITLLNVQMKT